MVPIDVDDKDDWDGRSILGNKFIKLNLALKFRPTTTCKQRGLSETRTRKGTNRQTFIAMVQMYLFLRIASLVAMHMEARICIEVSHLVFLCTWFVIRFSESRDTKWWGHKRFSFNR